MQIIFFLIAAFITGGASAYNLGSGFVGEATWISFALSCLVLIAWIVWTYVVISHSEKVKAVTLGASAFFLLCMVGICLYANWEDLSRIAILGGTGFACGIFFGLPFAGFSKIFAVIAMNRYLLLIPYMILIIMTWIIYGYVNKSGVATQYIEKKNRKEKNKDTYGNTKETQKKNIKQGHVLEEKTNMEEKKPYSLSDLIAGIQVEDKPEIPIEAEPEIQGENIADSIFENEDYLINGNDEVKKINEFVPETEIKMEIKEEPENIEIENASDIEIEEPMEIKEDDERVYEPSEKTYHSSRRDKRKVAEEESPLDEIQYLN